MDLQLQDITGSLRLFVPEIALLAGFLLIICAGLFKLSNRIITLFAIAVFLVVAFLSSFELENETSVLFSMLRTSQLTGYMKILINVGASLTCLLSFSSRKYVSEYFAVIIAIVFGSHLLVMTSNFLLLFVSFEIISIGSYILAGYAFDKTGSESSLKYLLFGSAASAVMLYGFSFLYGLTGSVDFTSDLFFNQVAKLESGLANFAILAVFVGLFFKISAAPMHFWAPDVYHAAPAPVVAFLSTVPKLAGLTALAKFFMAIQIFAQADLDWKYIVTIAIILTITVGNFAALKQTSAKRMMAYSSIAQSGFLMIGFVILLPQGIHFFLFYATVYVVMNFLVFTYINSFERDGITTIADYSGTGHRFVIPHVALLIGLIALTGLPPTAGFTGKLFLFSGIWKAFEHSGSGVLLALLVFGLLNTVVSLFYYLRLPYYAFFKTGKPAISHNILPFENLLGLFLVLVLLILFFQPGLLMSWINKINFVL